VFTVEERLKSLVDGVDLPERYHYCPPCWRLSTSKDGILLAQGFYVAGLQKLGVPNANFLGEQYRQKLDALVQKKSG